jgi:hypothetical protein
MAISRLSNSSIANGFPKNQSIKGYELPVKSNLGFWLDASDPTTLTESSGIVSQWNDKSGNGVNFTQSTSASRPSLYPDPVTRNQFLRFDGADDNMTAVNSFWSGKTSFSFFWAYKWNTGSGTDYEPIMTTTNSANSADNGSLHYINPSDLGAAYPMYVSNSPNAYDGYGSYISGKTNINEIHTSSQVYSVMKNGVAEGSLQFPGTPGASENYRINIAFQYQPARYAKLDIGEIIAYSSVLSAVDATKVRNYLNAKWRAY